MANQWRTVWQEAETLRQIASVENSANLDAEDARHIDVNLWFLLHACGVELQQGKWVPKGTIQNYSNAAQKLARVNFLFDVYRDSGSTEQQRILLVESLEELSPNKIRNRHSLIANFNPELWQACIEQVTRAREIAAKRMYLNYERVKDVSRMLEWKQKLIDTYPETAWATKVQMEEKK